MGRIAAATALLTTLAACGADPVEPEPQPAWQWNLPANFPTPSVPADNPMSEAKVELGRRLFYDRRLSANETQSCASCHQQAHAFSDPRAHAVGSTGEAHRRSSMSLANVAYASTLTWANPTLLTLEAQALVPIFGEVPVELGMAGKEQLLLDRLGADPDYPARFAEAFPDEAEPISVGTVVRAIAAFQRTLISGNSPYDRWVAGEQDALSEEAKRGMELFFSETAECFHCHGSFNFSDSVDHAGKTQREALFHNTNLYNLDTFGAYPDADPGLVELTNRPGDMGRFKAPTLRNIAVTAPYMHDGSVPTLEEVIENYAAGGRAVREGKGGSPLQSEFVKPFRLTEQEKQDLIAFLESLTDQQFLTDPRFGDPFAAGP